MFKLGRADRVVLQGLAVTAWVGAAVSAVEIVAGVAGWATAEMPTFPMGVSEPGPQVASGSAVFTAAAVSFGLSAGARALFAGAEVLSLAGVVAVAAAGFLFWTTGRGAGFGRALTMSAGVAGPTLAIGAILQAGLGLAAAMVACAEVGGAPFEFAASLNVGQVVTGLAITAVAYVFSRGSRLQQDTEGLV